MADARSNGAPPVTFEEPRPGRFGALWIRDFRFLFIGTVSSGFGQWAQMIGLNWLAFVISGESATQLALVASAGGGARLLAGPAIGVILDRYHRRTVLVWTTVISAAKGILLGVLVVMDIVNMPTVYVFAVLEGVVSTANQNTRQAFVFDVTTERTLANAVALNSIAQNISRIAGPPLTGVLIGFLGTASPFLFIGIVMIISTVFTLPISRNTRQAAPDRENPLRSMWVAVNYISKDRAMLGLILTSVVPALTVYPYVQLLPVFSEEVLGAGATGYGLLAAAIGWGSFSGLVALSMYGEVRRKGLVLLLFYVGYVGALILFTQSSLIVFALSFLVIAGLFHGVAITLSQTLVQLLARNDMRGRATSLFAMGFGLMPLGALPMGLAIDAFGVQAALGGFMTVSFVFFVFQTLFWKSLRQAGSPRRDPTHGAMHLVEAPASVAEPVR
ncbi:MAG: MFS transporter [Chloroflexi bacterium]|nr:MFS transporter [Chloroflexota bacterium]